MSREAMSTHWLPLSTEAQKEWMHHNREAREAVARCPVCDGKWDFEARSQGHAVGCEVAVRLMAQELADEPKFPGLCQERSAVLSAVYQDPWNELAVFWRDVAEEIDWQREHHLDYTIREFEPCPRK